MFVKFSPWLKWRVHRLTHCKVFSWMRSNSDQFWRPFPHHFLLLIATIIIFFPTTTTTTTTIIVRANCQGLRVIWSLASVFFLNHAYCLKGNILLWYTVCCQSNSHTSKFQFDLESVDEEPPRGNATANLLLLLLLLLLLCLSQMLPDWFLIVFSWHA